MYNRRRLGQQALGALGTFMVAPAIAAGQATPETPAEEGEVIRSITREEAKQQIREAFPFTEPAQQGGQVIYGAYGDIITLNGTLVSDSGTSTVTSWIYESLVSWSPVDGQFIPWLADSWEIAPDRVTYTFHLNQNVKWHDGTPFTADDVAFSYDALLDPATGSAYTTSAAMAIASYRVVDTHTFELVATEPLVTFLLDANVTVMPKHVWENVPFADWFSDPGSTGEDTSRVIGTGPFKLQEWVQGDRVVLVRNDDYWDDVPVIDEFVYQVMPDADTLVQSLKTGAIDILETIPPAQMEEVSQTEGLQVDQYDSLGMVGIFFNLDAEKTPLFQDREVRQALHYALDREAINENIYFGLGTVASGMLPVLSFGYDPDRITTTYTYDPDKARQLLADAGWVDTNGDGIVEKDGIELRFKLLSTEGGGATWEQLVSYMQEAWRAIGAELELENVGDQEWFDRMTISFDFELTYWGFNFSPDGSQGYLFRCDAYQGGFNSMRYCNPEYDQLDDLQIREFDPEKRRELLIQLNNIVNEDLPIAPIRFPKDRTGFTTRLHNFFPNAYGGAIWTLPYVWLEQ